MLSTSGFRTVLWNAAKNTSSPIITLSYRKLKEIFELFNLIMCHFHFLHKSF